MGFRPKYRVGEYVVDSEIVGDSESLMLIERRRRIIKNFKIDWIYHGSLYAVRENPITLVYKTTGNVEESRLAPLSSRIF